MIRDGGDNPPDRSRSGRATGVYVGRAAAGGSAGSRDIWNDLRARQTLRALFDAAIVRADPELILKPHLPQPPRGRCVVVGAGKAAATMAAAVEKAWPTVPLTGIVVVPYG
ncbi:MAG TPA: DUF4147 domain-containing protein, partial [Sphingomonas sp.]|nr:DUF4147 domain-containing protein [Sphingomonas sp.]